MFQNSSILIFLLFPFESELCYVFQKTKKQNCLTNKESETNDLTAAINHSQPEVAGGGEYKMYLSLFEFLINLF